MHSLLEVSSSRLNISNHVIFARDELEGILTFEECKDTLKSFSNGKSPGEDGFTVEFYRCFFDILGNDLVDSLNTAHEKGQLSIS